MSNLYPEIRITLEELKFLSQNGIVLIIFKENMTGGCCGHYSSLLSL